MSGSLGRTRTATGVVCRLCCCSPLQKTSKKKGRRGFRPWPLRCLSQFLPEKKIDCIKGECVAYLSSMGWHVIYSICFSQLDGDKDSFLLDEGFSFLIVVILMRDNCETFIRNYPTSLIDEIWFDLQDKQLLGIILLPLFVRFSLICRMWAFPITHVIGRWDERTELSFWAGARGLGVSLGLPLIWAWQVGLSAHFSNPISCPQPLCMVCVGKGCNMSRIGCDFHVSARDWIS